MSIFWQHSRRSFITRHLLISSSRTTIFRESFPQPVFIQLFRESSSSKRWISRSKSDPYAREAKVLKLKSRAAFKLLEIDSKHKLFKKGQTVVDLGYAPGSWTQIAVERTKPNGRIIGIDIIPAQTPKGASSIQGDFLSPSVQAEVKRFLSEPDLGRVKQPLLSKDTKQTNISGLTGEQSYIDLERKKEEGLNTASNEQECEPHRVVDIVLSDMSEPWEQTTGFFKRTFSDPYFRLKNNTGTKFQDHSASMDLCEAALNFANESLRVGGHFVCKFLQGAEDKELEKKLKVIFSHVYREKPDSSRKESKECYFVALRKKSSKQISTLKQIRQDQLTSIFDYSKS